MTGIRLRSIAAVATLVMASLSLSHELIYLLAHSSAGNYAQAMQEGGHDRYWTTFVLTVAVVSLALVMVVVRQLFRLRRLGASVRAGRLQVDDRALSLLTGMTARNWIVVTGTTSLGFLGQENLETVTAGHALPGFGVVGGEHFIALPVIALVSAAVALVGALVRWGRHVLLARLRRASELARRRAPHLPHLRSLDRPTSTVALDGHGLRAPPAPALA